MAELFAYAGVTEVDYDTGGIWLCADVGAPGIDVRFYAASPEFPFFPLDAHATSQSSPGHYGLARVGWTNAAAGNPATVTFQVYASIDAGSTIIGGPLPITWHHNPSVGAADYSSPAPDELTATILADPYPTHGTVRLDWTAVPSPDDHFTRVIYRLERATSPAGPWTLLTPTFPGYTALTYEDTQPNGTYYYRVLGGEQYMGSGNYSDIIEVTLGPAPALSRAAWGVLAR